MLRSRSVLACLSGGVVTGRINGSCTATGYILLPLWQHLAVAVWILGCVTELIGGLCLVAGSPAEYKGTTIVALHPGQWWALLSDRLQ